MMGMRKPAVLGLLCAAVLLVAYQQTSAKIGGVSLLVKPGQERADATLVRNAPEEVSNPSPSLRCCCCDDGIHQPGPG